MRLAQRLAFFAGSDVLMITPTRYYSCVSSYMSTQCHATQCLQEQSSRTLPWPLLNPYTYSSLALPLPLLCPYPDSALLTLPVPLLFPYPYSALTLTLPPSGMVWIDCPWSSHSLGTMRASCPHLKMSLALKGLASPIKVLYDAYIHTHIAFGKNDCDNSNGGDCSWRTDSVRIHCNFNKTPLVCSLSTYITAYILSLLLPFFF